MTSLKIKLSNLDSEKNDSQQKMYEFKRLYDETKKSYEDLMEKLEVNLFISFKKFDKKTKHYSL